MPKRKSNAPPRSDAAIPLVPSQAGDIAPLSTQTSSKKPRVLEPQTKRVSRGRPSTNPDRNAAVLDGPEALRASPDADECDERMDVEAAGMDPQTQIKQEDETPKSVKKLAKKDHADPEADEDEEADEEEIQAALGRPPAVNSDYLPLPWKGRLGYTNKACLNTYLRFSNPPVFSSRTCRIASILENRHPLTHPEEPPHATKNRPDKTKPPSIARGQAFVESLGKANAKDIVKMLRWNERYGIKFLRLSSEMFPFASHEEYGYRLAPFVSEELAAAGAYAAEHGHRLTTHPGQYTQLGSPRKSVIDNALRDLDYHAELLDLLKMPAQEDRDAVMILHLGGVFGDKEATLNRFRENYAKLPANVKKRLVLENDDVSWSVHELLPLCEELNIPMVLDFHHHNIIFDAGQCREGTKDIIDLFPRILATWSRKQITPKMHYSEPTPAAITGRQRRKHSPRVATLPPCPPTMDLMIEAKDKEQAVFELMRNFKLPGYETFNDILPHTRGDDNKPINSRKKANSEEEPPIAISEDDIGMGGPEGRVYWPPGMEEWLRPMKRVIKPKAEKTSAKKPKAESTMDASEAGLNGTPVAKKSSEKGTPKVKTPAKKENAPEQGSAKKGKKKAPSAQDKPEEGAGGRRGRRQSAKV